MLVGEAIANEWFNTAEECVMNNKVQNKQENTMPQKTTGVVYVRVKLKLELNLDEDEVQDLVSELDYSFKDYRIQETEIVDLTADYD
jgi:hypothetical protein